MAKRKSTKAVAKAQPTPTLQYFKSLEDQFTGMTLDEHADAIYQDNLSTFLNTLMHINLVHTHEKYKEKYKTIEEWAQDSFGWNRQRIYEYLQAYKVISVLEGINCTLLPANDYQARQLAKLDADDIRDVWSVVESQVNDGAKLTGTLVQQTVKLIKTEAFEDAQVEGEAGKKKKKTKATDEELAAELFDEDGNIIPDKPASKIYETEVDDEEHRRDVDILARRLKQLLKDAGFSDPSDMRDVALRLLEIVAE